MEGDKENRERRREDKTKRGEEGEGFIFRGSDGGSVRESEG